VYAAPFVACAICCIAARSVSGPKPIMITGTGFVGSSIFASSASRVSRSIPFSSSFLPSVMSSTELTFSASYDSRTRCTAASVVS
jgi:hypothetical protein